MRTIIAAVVAILARLATEWGITIDEAAWVNVAVEVMALLGVIWFRYTATKDLRRGTQLRKD